MPYERTWGADHPGCVIFLVDQSSSMKKEFEAGKAGGGGRVKDEVAYVLNQCLNELGSRCVKGDVVSPRSDVAVIGYGGGFVGSALSDDFAKDEPVSIAQLMGNPLRTVEVIRKGRDEDGEPYEYPVKFPLWVEPRGSGGTPMCGALEKAGRMASRWIRGGHERCFPPVVINITDGDATDGEPAAEAGRLRDLQTEDGNLLLFNCHLSPTSTEEVRYPVDSAELPDAPLARLLFAMSSKLPDSMRLLATQFVREGEGIQPDARGFVFNSDINGVMQMIQFSTVAAIKPARA